MARNKYVTPIDTIRRVDASIEQADIGSNVSLPVSSETILAHIEGVEDEFERRATELTDQTSTDELHEGIQRDYGWTVYLDEQSIKPLDTAKGDKVEIRSGQDTFTDVTDQTFVDTDAGIIEVDRRFVRVEPFYPSETNFRFRVTYRHGTGGDESGETTLGAAIADADTTPLTIGVTDASQIPAGRVVLVGGDEYFLVAGSDESTDELILSQRGLRGTTAESHESGDDVSYVPMNVRDAIAAKVGTRLLRQDDFQDYLNEGNGEFIDTQQKIDDLEKEFEAVISRYTTTSRYV